MLGCSGFYLYSHISIFGGGPIFQISSNRGYLRAIISDFDSQDWIGALEIEGWVIMFNSTWHGYNALDAKFARASAMRYFDLET